MATSKSTFQKRQKEMKRQEKQRMKAERRAQKKLVGRQDCRSSDGTARPDLWSIPISLSRKRTTRARRIPFLSTA